MSTRPAQTKARADAYFAFYAQMSPDRSLAQLGEQLRQVGTDVPSLRTLKRWSVVYDWQARVEEFDIRQSQLVIERAGDHVARMNVRHAKIGRSLQTAGSAAVDSLLERPGEVGAFGASRLVADGVKIERLAEGLATERHEVAVVVVNVIIHAIAELFEVVNELPTPGERTRAFVAGANRVIVEHFPDVAGTPS